MRFWRKILRRSFSSARTRNSFITTLTGSKYDFAATDTSTLVPRLASVAMPVREEKEEEAAKKKEEEVTERSALSPIHIMSLIGS